jgi:hypothetical protein
MTTHNLRGANNDLVNLDDVNQVARKTIVALREDQICDRCKTLDFEAFFRIPAKDLPPCGKYLTDLGRFRDIQKSDTCRVCALLTAVLPRRAS